jgi:hypothetical protein
MMKKELRHKTQVSRQNNLKRYILTANRDLIK